MSTSKNINEFLQRDEQKDLLRFLTAGSVDDGKSTLIGRLLHDSKRLYEDQLIALRRDTRRYGNAGNHIDYALLLDGLKAEREQGITIDVAYRYFSTNRRKFIIADTPGHEQYTRNMITGGSTANLAIILTDACNGILTQTRRHTYLISLLGIQHIILAVNKMDLVDYREERFREITAEYLRFARSLDIPDITPIPLSALRGDNVVKKSTRMPWYTGKSLLRFLETVSVENDRNLTDFRYPIQYVLRPDSSFRGFSGSIASGKIRRGEEVIALPSLKTTKIKSIVTYDGELQEAFAPQAVTLTLEDEIDLSRGEMLVHPGHLPLCRQDFEADIVWMDEKQMNTSTPYLIKHTTHLTRAGITRICSKTDVNTLRSLPATTLTLNETGRVILHTHQALLFDPYRKNKSTGSFILIDPVTNNTCAVGMIRRQTDPITDQQENGQVYRLPRVEAEKLYKQLTDTGKTAVMIPIRELPENPRLTGILCRQGICIIWIKE